MRSPLLPARRLALILALCGLAGAPASVKAQGKPLATLTSFGVLTDVRRSMGGGAIVPVQRGLGLHPGNVLQTDPRGRAEALLDDGTQMKVNVQTALQLLPTRARPIRVLHGRVFLRARSELRISTPIADCHVHGTDLHVEVADDGTTTLTVVEGEVEFSDPQGSVVVRDGLQSVARAGQPPTTPAPAVNLPSIIEWTNDVQP